MTLILASEGPLFQKATTSIHLQSALSNKSNWFCSFQRKWKESLWLKHFVSKIKISRFSSIPEENMQLIKATTKKRTRMWKGGIEKEIQNKVRVSYLTQAEAHWGDQPRPPEMSYLSVERVTAPSYLTWLCYHLLRRCQPCFVNFSEPLSTAETLPMQKRRAEFQWLSGRHAKE